MRANGSPDSLLSAARNLNECFETSDEVPRSRHGSRQTLETSINEEALLFAMYLRNEKHIWKPRTSLL